MDAAPESQRRSETLGSEIEVFFGNIRTHERGTQN